VGGPGVDSETGVSPEKSVLPEHPGLKSETWATHSIFVRAIFISKFEVAHTWAPPDFEMAYTKRDLP
jgi:hypothetical protein